MLGNHQWFTLMPEVYSLLLMAGLKTGPKNLSVEYETIFYVTVLRKPLEAAWTLVRCHMQVW